MVVCLDYVFDGGVCENCVSVVGGGACIQYSVVWDNKHWVLLERNPC